MSKIRPLYRSAMFIALKNDKGEYLLQRRANTGFLDGYYDLAPGHLEYGEPFEQCAVREAREEHGVDIAEADLVLAATFVSNYGDDVHYINVIYEVQKFTGKPKIGEPGKIDDLRWFSPDTLPEKMTVGAQIFFMAKEGGVVKNYYVDAVGYEEMTGKERMRIEGETGVGEEEKQHENSN